MKAVQQKITIFKCDLDLTRILDSVAIKLKHKDGNCHILLKSADHFL